MSSCVYGLVLGLERNSSETSGSWAEIAHHLKCFCLTLLDKRDFMRFEEKRYSLDRKKLEILSKLRHFGLNVGIFPLIAVPNLKLFYSGVPTFSLLHVLFFINLFSYN